MTKIEWEVMSEEKKSKQGLNLWDTLKEEKKKRMKKYKVRPFSHLEKGEEWSPTESED